MAKFEQVAVVVALVLTVFHVKQAWEYSQYTSAEHIARYNGFGIWSTDVLVPLSVLLMLIARRCNSAAGVSADGASIVLIAVFVCKFLHMKDVFYYDKLKHLMTLDSEVVSLWSCNAYTFFCVVCDSESTPGWTWFVATVVVTFLHLVQMVCVSVFVCCMNCNSFFVCVCVCVGVHVAYVTAHQFGSDDVMKHQVAVVAVLVCIDLGVAYTLAPAGMIQTNAGEFLRGLKQATADFVNN